MTKCGTGMRRGRDLLVSRADSFRAKSQCAARCSSRTWRSILKRPCTYLESEDCDSAIGAVTAFEAVHFGVLCGRMSRLHLARRSERNICEIIRKAGVDTVQLTHAFQSQRFEIIDCRQAHLPSDAEKGD